MIFEQIMIYQAVILPGSTHGAEIWIRPGQGGIGPLEHMEKTHKFAARIVANNYDWNCMYPDLLDSIGWKSFTQVVWQRKIASFWSYVNGTHFCPPGVIQPLPQHPSPPAPKQAVFWDHQGDHAQGRVVPAPGAQGSQGSCF